MVDVASDRVHRHEVCVPSSLAYVLYICAYQAAMGAFGGVQLELHGRPALGQTERVNRAA